MKRIQPVRREPEADYPTAAESGESRRGFLRSALGWAGALGLGALAGGSLGSCTPNGRGHRRLGGTVPMPRYGATIELLPPVRVTGCQVQVTRVAVRTRNEHLGKFLEDKDTQVGVQQAVARLARKQRCASPSDYQSLRNIRQALTDFISDSFKKKHPDVHVSNTWVNLVTRPAPPLAQPPRKKRRGSGARSPG